LSSAFPRISGSCFLFHNPRLIIGFLLLLLLLLFLLVQGLLRSVGPWAVAIHHPPAFFCFSHFYIADKLFLRNNNKNAKNFVFFFLNLNGRDTIN
jgi:hypothetical protein